MDNYLPIKSVIGTNKELIFEGRPKYNILRKSKGGYLVQMIPLSSVFSGNLIDVYYKLDMNNEEEISLVEDFKKTVLTLDEKVDISPNDCKNYYDSKIYVPKHKRQR